MTNIKKFYRWIKMYQVNDIAVGSNFKLFEVAAVHMPETGVA